MRTSAICKCVVPGADVCVRGCRQMVDVAQAEERVILTCDRTFIRMGYSDQAFYVRTTNKQEQVKEVLAHFDITIKEDSLLSRCAKCNGTFYPRWAGTAVYCMITARACACHGGHGATSGVRQCDPRWASSMYLEK